MEVGKSADGRSRRDGARARAALADETLGQVNSRIFQFSWESLTATGTLSRFLAS